MSSLHSLLGNLLMAGTIYGWRIDAILVGGLLWILLAGVAQLEHSLAWPRLAAARA